jgi:ribonuclease R
MTLPSEQRILELFQQTARQQFTMKNLQQHFNIPATARPAFRRSIRDLVARGRLVRVRGSRYALPERQHSLVGGVQRHEDGYGFVVPDTEGQEDVYVPRKLMLGVMHGDRVLVRLDASQRRGERRSGSVTQVLERPQQEVVGRVDMVGKACYVVPVEARLCPEISIPPQERGGAQRGHLVVAEISRYALGQAYPQGRIVEVLGYADDPDMEMRLILHKYALPRSFPPEVEAEAAAVPQQIRPHELTGRQNLRQLITFTIDAETARDFDDAVSLEILPNGHSRLGVHIADVSHYVREGSPLDREAYDRGTSVYFPDQVIPMLPPRLSNEICCLQPEVDRLCMSVFVDLTPEAEVIGYDITDTVICSQARLTYNGAAEYLDGNPRILAGCPPAIGEVLQRMDVMATRLRARRFAEGSIDFDLPESDIVLDNEGRIDKILRAERHRAHMLIEEFMLLANRTIAAHLAELAVPALYRIHEPPNLEKIAQFNAFVGAFGYAVEGEEALQPRAVQAVLAAVAGKPEEMVINHLLLRSMQRARYAPQNSGHFGLAFTHYTHFTSPIRRYPDLIVHRLLRDTRRQGGLTAARRDFWASRLPEMAEHTSLRERRADDAERDVVELKKVEFMLDKLGQEYDGVITGVTRFGLFVELVDLFIEGLIHITGLPDTYVYHPDRFSLVGQHTGQVFRLGDRLRVRVDNVNVTRRQIDFSFLARQ